MKNDEVKKSHIEEATPHIIRRKVKVVTTDNEGNKVENITTNAMGNVSKTSVVYGNNSNTKNMKRNTEEARPQKYGNNGMHNKPRHRNNMQNIVVTQNGKKIEPKPVAIEKKVEAPVVKKEQEIIEKPQVVQTPAQKVEVQKSTAIDNKQYNNNKPQKSVGNFKPRGEYKPNNNFSGNNRDNRDGFKPRYNKDSKFGENRGYNNQGDGRKYNNNNNNSSGDNNSRPGFNNRPRPNKDFKQQKDNSGYKINKFIKDSQMNETVQKETRDYTSTYIDKRKFNEEKTNNETRKDKKNVNVMREEDTRMDFAKLRGMQVSEDGLMDLYDRGENRKSSMKKKKQQQKIEMNTTKIIPLTEVELPSIMSVKEFAETIKKTASEVIKKLFSLGIMATVNQEIDFDTAFLVAGEFGITATLQVVVTEEDVLFDDTDDDESELEVRPPIVTIMGHVDHGKTSLLDKIRATNVVAGESGGITQHIGAYKVSLNDREITFLDTPGHEAFSEMRARGAQVTDIVIIVVAADDSIKPQTIEAINHAKAADVPIIVAINKIDKPAANVEKVKQDLLEHDLVAEEWGGQTICVPVSAKTGEGIDNLLEMVLLVADMQNLRANPHKQAKGTVIEAKLDKSRGPLATVLVQRGTLNVGDTIVLGEIIGRVRVMTNDKGEKVKTAGPSTPVELLGLGAVPSTGDVFYEVEDEKTAHKLIERRKAEQRINLMKKGSTVTLDDLFDKIKDGELKNLDIVLRADVQGSVEALKSSLEKLSTDEVRVRVIASNTGGITESDVTLAKLSHAIIIGFNVRPDANVTATADKEKVDIRLYRVIYDAINDVEAAMKGMLKPTYKEVVHGQAEVRHLFKISSVGTICGSYVTNGKIVRNAMMRVVRDGVIVIEDKLDSLKREKDDAKEVAQGYECGIKLEKFNDVKEGDILECYEMVEEARS